MPKNDPDDLLEEGEEEGKGGGGSAVAEVAVKGKGKSVTQALKNAGLKDTAKGLQQKFQDLLKNPRNKAVAKRIAPKTWQQGDKKYDCEDSVEVPLPMTLDEITAFLKENYGGKKWNVRVLDEDGEVQDGRNIDVPGNPIINADAMEQFEVPSVEDLGLGDDEDDGKDPQDRELASKQKEQRILELDEQIAKKKRQIAELEGKGNGQHKESPEEVAKKAVADALAAQQAKHDAEMRALKDEQDKQSMERRMTDSFNAQINALKELITKKPDDAGGAIRDVLARIDNLKLEFNSNLKDTLGSYKDAVNQQIGSLEKHVNTQIAAIQQSINQMASHKPESPFKDVVPLITSSIEKSSAGYKEVIGPLLTAMTTRSEAESAPPTNPVKETIELLQMTGAIPGPNSQPKDFGNRVVDFAEKMAPDVLNFIERERTRGAEITKETVQNQLKIIAQKISNEVSQHASKTIQQIAAQRGLPAPQPQQQAAPQQQAQPGQQQQQPAQQQVAPNQVPNQNPVGQITPEEQARYAQRHITAAVPSGAPEAEEEEEEVEEELSPEEEMAARVNDTLSLLDREMVVRPKKITWTRFAWDNLPGDVLDKVVFANDDADVYEAIKPYADEELANRIWGRIKAKADAKEFIVAGINQIKAWAVQIEEQKRQAAAAMQQAQQQAQPPPAQ